MQRACTARYSIGICWAFARVRSSSLYSEEEMCAAATEVSGYQKMVHWDDPPQSSWPENFHDPLLGEHLEQFSSQAASSPEEESQVIHTTYLTLSFT